ncbi:MAG: cysteine--tRNA ligase [Saprospiraceae bacterium]|nr:cysteine--tRNA ligase [Saprospiraceae bacterium]
MTRKLSIYNSLSREKEALVPITEGRLGMYVCGPTVYNDVHLGNCRTFVSFDIIYRYLLKAGYKVRYVRNITDVGHLLDDGEDRMSKGARLDQLEPMEVAQKYTYGFHEMMQIFNTLSPSIEPRATGHIIEQIKMVHDILDRGYAYIKNGSVYFDTPKFIKDGHPYGKLSGRIVEDLLTETRDNLKNQDEKNHPSDFALWIKATEEHIMRWESPWSVGFPGWHLECSAMSTKYLGENFDIHGGGNDLKFPHHENEIAQNVGSCGHAPAKYWLHTNMLLLNGKKMSKSDGNTISPPELFSGQSEHISKAYSPMVVKFFMMQAHYRSPLDITDDALQAAEKGFKRLMETLRIAQEHQPTLPATGNKDLEIQKIIDGIWANMDDDFNVPNALSGIFELSGIINSIKDGHLKSEEVGDNSWKEMCSFILDFVHQVMALKNENEESDVKTVGGLMDLIIDLRKDIREKKDWAASDKIRDALLELGIQLKDGKAGTEWNRS